MLKVTAKTWTPGAEDSMLCDGEPADLLAANLDGRLVDRNNYPSDPQTTDEFSVRIRIKYTGKYAEPLFRLFLHGMVTYGVLAETQRCSDILLGLLADPTVRRGGSSFRAWARADGFYFDAMFTPERRYKLRAGQALSWRLHPWDPGNPFLPRIGGLLGHLTDRIRRGKSGELTASGEVLPHRGVTGRPGKWRFASGKGKSYQEVAFPLSYFCDPFFGESGLRVPGQSRMTEALRSYREWSGAQNFQEVLLRAYGELCLFDRVGVLVSASPEYLPLAEKLRLKISVGNRKGDKAVCQVGLKTLKESGCCRKYPCGWVGSVPFSLPFPGDWKNDQVSLSLIFDDEQLTAVRGLEGQCVRGMKEKSTDFLIITPYLLGEGYEREPGKEEDNE